MKICTCVVTGVICGRANTFSVGQLFVGKRRNVAVSRFERCEDLRRRYIPWFITAAALLVHTRRVIIFISIMTGEQLNLHGKSHRSVTKFARGSVIVLLPRLRV